MSQFTMIYEQCQVDISRALASFDRSGECRDIYTARWKLAWLVHRWQQLKTVYRNTEVEGVLERALREIVADLKDAPDSTWIHRLHWADQTLASAIHTVEPQIALPVAA